jgi:hypothetical protein
MLPKFVEEDSDLPELLSTPAKQQKRAKTLAAAHSGKKPNGALAPGAQGYFSRTWIVKLTGGDRIVIQFRIQPLEVDCFETARSLFGDVVPEITAIVDPELEALGMTTYAMTYMPGQCLFRLPDSKVQARTSIAESLGAVLGRGLVDGQSADVVDSYIIPCLTQFLTNITERTEVLKPNIERLIAAAAGVKALPLYFSHHDLNETNILIGEDNLISGLVDWECARALPSGMGLHRITDTIVAQNC